MLQWSEHQVLQKLRLNVDLSTAKIRSWFCLDARNLCAPKTFPIIYHYKRKLLVQTISEIEIVVKYILK